MGVLSCAALFLLLSTATFSFVYVLLHSSAVGRGADQRVVNAISNLNSERTLRNDLNLQALTNPFSVCPAYSYETHHQGVGVVILVHNKLPHVILQTVKSILANSGSVVPQIMIVDDHSSFPVKKWKEWKSISSIKPIKVITLDERKGYAYSKSIACEQLNLLGNIDVVVFLEGGSIVSSDWLSPILHTLGQHPTSLVYPSIDIFDDVEDFFYKSGNTVATFDWSLHLTWEDLDASQETNALKMRFPLIPPNHKSVSDTVYSPAVPSTFAARLDYLESIGGFSSSPLFSVFSSDNIELSLRAWLCANGGIIRQPCSRVALRRKIQKSDPNKNQPDHSNHVIVDVFEGIGSEAGMHADDEYTQFNADEDALTVAEMWMGGDPYSQFVINSRIGWGSSDEGGKGTGRFPYIVKQPLDARHSHLYSNSNGFGASFDRGECKRFAWYLHAVFPGLLLDLPVSEMHYMDNTQRKNLKEMMSPVMKQYQASSIHTSAGSIHSSFSPKVASYRPPSEDEITMAKRKADEDDLAYRIRDELLCMDVNNENCAKEKENNGCEGNIGYNMFHCPKTCGFCTAGNKALCIDYYLNKCPKMASEGMCNEGNKVSWMEQNCRESCKICT